MRFGIYSVLFGFFFGIEIDNPDKIITTESYVLPDNTNFLISMVKGVGGKSLNSPNTTIILQYSPIFKFYVEKN